MTRFIILFILILAIDLYTFKGIRLLTVNLSTTIQYIIHIGFWFITASIIVSIVLFSANYRGELQPDFYRKLFFIMGFTVLIIVPKLVFISFHFADDIVHIIRLIFAKLFRVEGSIENSANTISRAKFITQVGVVAAAIPFVSIIYGMAKGRFNYKLRKLKMTFSNLPVSFNGLKVLQISDFHIGSFTGKQNEVEQIVELINEQKADLILFTGDLVNNYASETDEFVEILKKLKANIGMYSILGNHDYGDYGSWESKSAKEANLNKLIDRHKEIGFNILLNDSDTISINGEEIVVIGVENWGLPPFPQYGNLQKAMNGSVEKPFKMLLSHDPSHWDSEVIRKTNIDLTFSGHTHGMQFGVEIGNWKWSPVKFKYPRWAGLYTENNQHLYVNRGIGFIAFPGRVGIMPEITVIELNSNL